MKCLLFSLCFKIFASKITRKLMWHAAQNACISLGGNLATIPHEQVRRTYMGSIERKKKLSLTKETAILSKTDYGFICWKFLISQVGLCFAFTPKCETIAKLLHTRNKVCISRSFSCSVFMKLPVCFECGCTDPSDWQTSVFSVSVTCNMICWKTTCACKMGKWTFSNLLHSFPFGYFFTLSACVTYVPADI